MSLEFIRETWRGFIVEKGVAERSTTIAIAVHIWRNFLSARSEGGDIGQRTETAARENGTERHWEAKELLSKNQRREGHVYDSSV